MGKQVFVKQNPEWNFGEMRDTLHSLAIAMHLCRQLSGTKPQEFEAFLIKTEGVYCVCTTFTRPKGFLVPRFLNIFTNLSNTCK